MNGSTEEHEDEASGSNGRSSSAFKRDIYQTCALAPFNLKFIDCNFHIKLKDFLLSFAAAYIPGQTSP